MQNTTPQKVCYFDTETTGTDPDTHGIIQIAMIIEIGGDVLAEKEWCVRPHLGLEIDPKALAVNGRTLDEIKNFPTPDEIFGKMQKFLGRYVNQYDRTDKLTPVGYNVKFDLDFLKSFWARCGDDKYFGSWFNWDAVDPLALLRYLKFAGLLPPLENLKLGTVCEHFGIALGDDAHDAMADIKAPRELVCRLRDSYLTPLYSVDKDGHIKQVCAGSVQEQEGVTCDD